MYERDMTPMDFRAINRAVSRRAVSAAPDAPTMRAFRPALWFLWLTGARAEEMRRARWHQWAGDRLRVGAKGQEVSIQLDARAAGLLRWLHDRRDPGQPVIFPGSDGREWSMQALHAAFAEAVKLALLPSLSIRAIRLAHAGLR
jgi:integrase